MKLHLAAMVAYQLAARRAERHRRPASDAVAYLILSIRTEPV